MCRFNRDLGDAIEYAAGNLPAGWEIELWVEEGGAGVRLQGPDGKDALFDSADMTLAQEVRHATSLAKKCAST